jgi:hypothetical protein
MTTTMTTAPIDLSGVKQEQLEAAVLKNSTGVAGVAEALSANKMPKELLQTLQEGISGSQRGRS